MALLVTYDLHNPGQDYLGLYQQLQAVDAWWHYLDSTWILITNETPDDLFQRLRPYLDQNDSILILEVGDSSRQGWLTQEAWDWLRDHL